MRLQDFQSPSPAEDSISNLDVLVAGLPADDREIFHRIYSMSVSRGRLKTPASMQDWLEEQFGSLDAVSEQKVLRLTNLITLEGTIFNSMRASRPFHRHRPYEVEADFDSPSRSDPFCSPLTDTPEDFFGRVEGKYCITASNVAKFEGLHAVIVFQKHNPLRFTLEEFVDYIDTGLRWAYRAHEADPSAKYYFCMWNCLWRAGATLAHGHMQVTLGHDIHYAKIEGLRRAALLYRNQYQTNYFDSLYQIHHSLGCGFDRQGVRIMVSLTPIKEKEVILMSDSPDLSGFRRNRNLDSSLKERAYEVLQCLQEEMGVASFNLALYMPPIAEVEEDWNGFPIQIRIVDRGWLTEAPSDIGAMELYSSSVVASDPFEVIRVLKRFCGITG